MLTVGERADLAAAGSSPALGLWAALFAFSESQIALRSAATSAHFLTTDRADNTDENTFHACHPRKSALSAVNTFLAGYPGSTRCPELNPATAPWDSG